ncbi:zinc finger domain-containing protein [Streptomyces lydicamycinicus]|uniref:zinc finger domain-containing protein n=1 Tax=Streptomyces lydicamycinicus TaxID=1546107 RepID=UPI003C2FC946
MPDSLRRGRSAELAAACPRCHAQPGARCTSPRGRNLTQPHPSRLDTQHTEEPTPWPYRPPQPQ